MKGKTEAELTGEIGWTGDTGIKKIGDDVTFCFEKGDVFCSFSEIIEIVDADLFARDRKEC